MHETGKAPEPSPIPDAVVVPGGRSRLALIWIVPLFAALIGLGLVVKAVLERGPEITLRFASAEGLEANKTKLRYKDVDIGTVTDVALSEDRRTVRVTVQVSRPAEPLLRKDSRFWVVRPRISGGDVTGISTLLSGSYIAMDAGKEKESRRDFVGLETQPIVTSDRPGREFLLKAADLASLDVGSPIYLRRIQVGRIIGYDLDANGMNVMIRIFVNAPYDKFVTANTRFWLTSGLELTLDANGMRLSMPSFVGLLLGGIAFLPDPALPADKPSAAGSRFTLYADEHAASQTQDGETMSFVFVFQESVRGLSVGAPIDFRGLPVGEVTHIDGNFNPNTTDFAIAVTAELHPHRLVPPIQTAQDEDQRFPLRATLDKMIARGLRGQLRNGNLLTGQRYIALDYFPNAKPAAIDWTAGDPVLPAQKGDLEVFQTQVANTLSSLKSTLDGVDKLARGLDKNVSPELALALKEVRATLNSINRLAQNLDQKAAPELTTTLRAARQSLNRMDQLLASDAPVQQDLRETLREVTRAAISLRQLADLLERQPEVLLSGKKGD